MSNRPVSKVEEEEAEASAETKATKETKKKKAELKPSEALKHKDTFIRDIRNAAKPFLTELTKEFEAMEPGHPNYSELKFAKIRAERVLYSMDELSRGKPVR